MNEAATFGGEVGPVEGDFAAHNRCVLPFRTGDNDDARGRQPENCGRAMGEPLRPVQGSVWNHLKRQFFLLHPAAVLNIDGLRFPMGLPFV